MRWIPFLWFLAAAYFASFGECATVLQITDFHLDIDYNTTAGSRAYFCHYFNATTGDKLGAYGDYMCDSPKALVKYAINGIRNFIIGNEPSFLLWTGDSIPHIPDTMYGENYVFETIQRITNLLNAANFTNVIPVFGNHDYSPANAFPDRMNYIYNHTFSLWKHWIGPENEDTFLRGGYYKYELPGSTRILALNTNLYYRFNNANFTSPVDPSGQFAFMENVLGESRSRNESVHIVAHVPPGVFERSPNFTWFRPEYNRRFIEIVVKYAATIKWMIFGHHHTDTFQIIKDQSGNAVQVMLMSPSVTPLFSTLPGGDANNPAFRIFTYDPQTWDIQDIDTYYVNLTTLNQQFQLAQWEKEYSFREAYGIRSKSVSPAAMNDVLEQMKRDDTLFQRYIQYNSVLFNVSMPVGVFRDAQLCSIEYVNYDDYYRCMANSPTETSSTPLPSTPSIQATSSSARVTTVTSHSTPSTSTSSGRICSNRFVLFVSALFRLLKPYER